MYFSNDFVLLLTHGQPEVFLKPAINEFSLSFLAELIAQILTGLLFCDPFLLFLLC